MEERGIEITTGRVLVRVSPEFFRPSEVHLLIGDATKAKEKLGWEPSTPLDSLVQMMVAADLEEQRTMFHSLVKM